MLLVALAHAGTYTDTFGSAAELSAGNGHNDGSATVIANIFEVTTSVDLTGIELYAKESDSDCTSCDISPRLWTYDAGAGTWSTGSWLGASMYVGGAAYAWETVTVTTTRLEAGTTYAVGFWVDNFTYFYKGPGVDPAWATVSGYSYADYMDGPTAAAIALDGTDAFYMRLTVEAPDDDGDGFDVFDDCNDTDPVAYPGAEEIWYDGQDQDCDEGSDYDQDADGEDADGYGGDDCDDEDAAIRPGVPERWYDGVDQDCDGGSDYDQDADGDPTPAGGGTDCDDRDPAFGANAAEEWYDGVDQDCDGGSDYDQDGDGQDTPSAGGQDCDDTDATVYAGAPEVWYDGVDQACDGGPDDDQDGDGAALADDCEDTDPTRAADCSDPEDSGGRDSGGAGGGDWRDGLDDGGGGDKTGGLCGTPVMPGLWAALLATAALVRRRRG